ncbi:histidine phosphatase family protein [Brachybacterium sp. EF45031]|uniref:histidine phosphatase family protein n=1 Tax=Brachybacterium sillae TaxID=2810536 RepID=UPI00217E4D73|nr:histidine phosphatase family protein [Brachybacterium sillae]MCS6710821.1 histidine phosphatase family protein [Brachybacterium sillae]
MTGRGPAPSAGTGVAPGPESAGRSLLILARHGQTDHNVARRLQGQIDIPLNARGREQAVALGRSLAAAPPDLIITSPLGRAQETAQAVGDATGAPVQVDAAFLERGFGQWEGLTYDEIDQRWPEEYASWREDDAVQLPQLGIEDRPAVARRVGERCRQLLGEHPGRRILVVAHGAAITLGIVDLLGLDPYAFRGLSGLGNCHRSELEWLQRDPEGRLMRLLSHNQAPDFA